MGLASIGRGIFGGKVFGKKNIAGAAPQSRGNFRSRSDGNALDRLVAEAQQRASQQDRRSRYHRTPKGCVKETVDRWTAEERGEFLVAITKEEKAFVDYIRDPNEREEIMAEARCPFRQSLRRC